MSQVPPRGDQPRGEGQASAEPFPSYPGAGQPPPSYPGAGQPPPSYPGAGQPPPSYPGAGQPPPLPRYPGTGQPPPPPGYPPGGPTSGAPYPTGESVLANYGARLGGWVIDYVILYVAGVLIELILSPLNVLRTTFHISSNTASTSVHYYHFSFLAILVHLVVVILYGGLLCGSSNGQTIGMMATGVRAVQVTDGTPLGAGRGIGRAAFEYVLFVLLIVPWIIDMLWPLWDEKNQTLHDKVVGCVVVKRSLVPPGTVYSRASA